MSKEPGSSVVIRGVVGRETCAWVIVYLSSDFGDLLDLTDWREADVLMAPVSSAVIFMARKNTHPAFHSVIRKNIPA